MSSHIVMLYNHFNHYQHLFLHQKQMSKSPVITKLVAPILHKRKIVITFAPQRSPDGGIGRRAGLKHQWIHFHPGSTPGLGTEAEKVEKLSPFFFSTPRNSLVC